MMHRTIDRLTQCEPRDRGYSLIELLAVLTVMSFIAMLALGGVRFGSQVWSHIAKASALADAREQTQLLVANTLGRARPWRDAAHKFHGVQGAADAVDFYAPPLEALRGAGFTEYQLAAQDAFLVLRWRTAAQTGDWRAARLVGKLDALTIAYRSDDMSAGAWTEAWPSDHAPPSLVRLTLHTDTETVQILVRLRILRDPICNYDPVAMDCRNP